MSQTQSWMRGCVAKSPAGRWLPEVRTTSSKIIVTDRRSLSWPRNPPYKGTLTIPKRIKRSGVAMSADKSYHHEKFVKACAANGSGLKWPGVSSPQRGPAGRRIRNISDFHGMKQSRSLRMTSYSRCVKRTGRFSLWPHSRIFCAWLNRSLS